MPFLYSIRFRMFVYSLASFLFPIIQGFGLKIQIHSTPEKSFNITFKKNNKLQFWVIIGSTLDYEQEHYNLPYYSSLKIMSI